MVVQYILAARTVTRKKKPAAQEGEQSENAEKDSKENSTENKPEAPSEEVPKLEEKEGEPEEVDKTPCEEDKPTKVDDESGNTTDKKEKSDIADAANPEKDEEKTENDEDMEEVEEYYVKYRNFSYLHCEWKTEEELFKGDKRIAAKLKRFKQKMAHNTNIFENVRFFIVLMRCC